MSDIKTPLTVQDAEALAWKMDFQGRTFTAIRYDVAKLLMRVDVASREQATEPQHDEHNCHVCASNAAKRAAEAKG